MGIIGWDKHRTLTEMEELHINGDVGNDHIRGNAHKQNIQDTNTVHYNVGEYGKVGHF